jgi:hypothetical protein
VRSLGLLAAACAVTLTACGSSDGSGNRSGSNGRSAGIQFADCMRSHGVPNFPDPGAGGGINMPDGVDPKSPAFQSARTACFKLLPGGGPLRAPASESRKLGMLKLSQCIRSHGVSSFPDPTATPPRPSPGGGIAFGSPGSFIAVPEALMQTPAFRQAAADCGFPGAGKAAKAVPAG